MEKKFIIIRTKMKNKDIIIMFIFLLFILFALFVLFVLFILFLFNNLVIFVFVGKINLENKDDCNTGRGKL
jgi:hypothetical protein